MGMVRVRVSTWALVIRGKEEAMVDIPSADTRSIEGPSDGALRHGTASGQEELCGVLLDLLTTVGEEEGTESKEDDGGEGKPICDRDQRHSWRLSLDWGRGREGGRKWVGEDRRKRRKRRKESIVCVQSGETVTFFIFSSFSNGAAIANIKECLTPQRVQYGQSFCSEVSHSSA